MSKQSWEALTGVFLEKKGALKNSCSEIKKKLPTDRGVTSSTQGCLKQA